MLTHRYDDSPSFERFRYRAAPARKPDRAKPKTKRPWRMRRRRETAFAMSAA